MYKVKINIPDLTKRTRVVRVKELDEWGSLTIEGTLYDFHVHTEMNVALNVSIYELKDDGEGGQVASDVSYQTEVVLVGGTKEDMAELKIWDRNNKYYYADTDFSEAYDD
jgi:hypothetical protein